MLCSGDTAAVFQMESDGMTRLMKQLAPEGMEDLIPLVALYRPGPLGSGMAEDLLPAVTDTVRPGTPPPDGTHCADTYGVILYQEQVMQIASALAGFTLGEADILRRAMGKKKASVLDSMKEKFLQGAEKLHASAGTGDKIFALLQHFAGYGFNKSHSAAYALVAYQTAWLKANYPVEYMAAFLNSIISTADKVSWYIGVCNGMGVKVLPPDINSSEAGFSVDGKNIRFGLGAIKSVGDAAVSVIWKNGKNTAFLRTFLIYPPGGSQQGQQESGGKSDQERFHGYLRAASEPAAGHYGSGPGCGCQRTARPAYGPAGAVRGRRFGRQQCHSHSRSAGNSPGGYSPAGKGTDWLLRYRTPAGSVP